MPIEQHSIPRPKENVFEPKELLEQFRVDFLNEVGQAKIRELNPVARHLADLLRGVAQALSNRHCSPLARSDSPAWVDYVFLNLKGVANEPIAPQAIRFGHVLIADRNTSINKLDNLSPSQIEVYFDNILKFVPFPWFIPNTELTMPTDKRLAVLGKTKAIDLRKTTDIENVQFVSGSPMILIINDSKQSRELSKSLLKQQIAKVPFIIVINTATSRSLCSFQIIANHEYLDGVPSAYYLRELAEKLGYRIPERYGNIDRLQIAKIAAWCDELENCFATDGSYNVKTIVLSQQLLDQFRKLHQLIKEKNNCEIINLENLFQILALYSHGVDGKNIKGGTLKFSQNFDQQLDHFAVDNIQQLLEALINGDKETVDKLGYLTKKGTVGLTRPEHSNIEGVLGAMQKLLPEKYWPLINELSKRLGIASAIAGQVMISSVPKRITKKNHVIPLGGFGGPAVTEYQDVGMTFGMDCQTDPPLIIVRRKYRQEA